MSDDGRKAILGKVHIAKKQLGLDDDAYRAIVERVTGKRSAGDCDAGALGRLVAEFQRLGFSDRPKHRAPSGPNAGMAGKLFALWFALHHLGEAEEPSEARLLAFIARQSGGAPAALRFATPGQLSAAIEGVKAWLGRLGVAPESWDAADLNRAMLAAIWSRYAPLGRGPAESKLNETSALANWVGMAVAAGRNTNLHALSEDDLNAAVRKLAAAYLRKLASVGAGK